MATYEDWLVFPTDFCVISYPSGGVGKYVYTLQTNMNQNIVKLLIQPNDKI